MGLKAAHICTPPCRMITIFDNGKSTRDGDNANAPFKLHLGP